MSRAGIIPESIRRCSGPRVRARIREQGTREQGWDQGVSSTAVVVITHQSDAREVGL